MSGGFQTRIVADAASVGVGRCIFALLSAVLVSGRCAQAEEPPSAEKAVSRATAWLVEQQSADGGWHSETYGAYRGGVGTTAIAVRALCEDRTERSASSCRRGLGFLLARHDERGFVVAPDGASDNALYATAVTARSLTVANDAGFTAAQKALKKTLAESQHLETPTSPDGGGWASLVTAQTEISSETPCNISATAAVLMTSPPLRDRQAAESFVRRCQNLGEGTHNDGGFFFAPHADHPLNKLSDSATSSGKPHPVSYFPPTCDGILALSRLGLSPESDELTRAIERLGRLPRPTLMSTAPLPDGPHPAPIDGLYFYSAAAFGEVWMMFPSRRERLRSIRDELVKTIVQRQRENGEWVNPVKTMREDDPLIATSLAIIALRKLAAQ